MSGTALHPSGTPAKDLKVSARLGRCRRWTDTLMTAVAIACTICLPAPAEAQRLQFSKLTADDGLSGPWVPIVYQDVRGFMWFGTRRGLDDGAFAGAAFDAGAGQGVLQFAKPRRVGDSSESCAEFLGEFGQRFDI